MRALIVFLLFWTLLFALRRVPWHLLYVYALRKVKSGILWSYQTMRRAANVLLHIQKRFFLFFLRVCTALILWCKALLLLLLKQGKAGVSRLYQTLRWCGAFLLLLIKRGKTGVFRLYQTLRRVGCFLIQAEQRLFLYLLRACTTLLTWYGIFLLFLLRQFFTIVLFLLQLFFRFCLLCKNIFLPVGLYLYGTFFHWFLLLKSIALSVKDGRHRMFNIMFLSLFSLLTLRLILWLLQGQLGIGIALFVFLIFTLYAKEEPRKIPWALLMGTFLVLEVGLRFLLGNMRIVETVRNPPDGRCVALVPNTTKIYTGWLWKAPPVRHEVNRLGYRGKPRFKKKPPGTYRIAILGDSFAFGQGVESDETMSFYLEKVLLKTPQRVEVLNFGFPGYNLTDAVNQFKLFAHQWNPDLVLLLLVENDLEPSVCDSISDSDLLGFVIMHSYAARSVFLLSEILTKLYKNFRKSPHRLKKVFLKELKTLKETCAEKKAVLAVVVLGDPLQLQTHDPKKRNQLEIMFTTLKVLWLDGTNWRNSHSSRIPREGHLNKEGNRLAAAHIAAWLHQKGIIKHKP